MMTKRVLK